ncbi:MAG TPA: PDZ domain-containing protein [Planctomycetes bacterium]|nr:PDZ domain-containing protein [Planctomycetota bacterium]
MTSPGTTALAIAAVIATLTAPLTAQRLSTMSQGDAVRKAYASTVLRANLSVLSVHADGDQRVLGTCVAPDLVVTKLSELSAKDRLAKKAPSLTCKQGKETWNATLLGFDRASDIALLRLKDAKLTPVEWQLAIPKTGAFLATPNGEKWPLGVGILGASPYQHTRAFLGIRFANAEDARAELAEVVEHGAARAAGLLVGDVVVEFAGDKIEWTSELRARIGQCQPGDKVAIKVRRDGKELSFIATLGTNNSPPRSGQNNSPPRSGQEDVWGDLSVVRSGFQQVLQHDTVLKPKDCGGPVVDLTGKVLGVNIARAGRVETLALPAATVQKLVKKLLAAAAKKSPGEGY